MASGEGDTWHARCHTHKMHVIYVEGGGHVGGGGGGGGVIQPPPIKATKRKKRQKKKKESGGGKRVAWEKPKREEAVRGEEQN